MRHEKIANRGDAGVDRAETVGHERPMVPGLTADQQERVMKTSVEKYHRLIGEVAQAYRDNPADERFFGIEGDARVVFARMLEGQPANVAQRQIDILTAAEQRGEGPTAARATQFYEGLARFAEDNGLIGGANRGRHSDSGRSGRGGGEPPVEPPVPPAEAPEPGDESGEDNLSSYVLKHAGELIRTIGEFDGGVITGIDMDMVVELLRLGGVEVGGMSVKDMYFGAQELLYLVLGTDADGDCPVVGARDSVNEEFLAQMGYGKRDQLDMLKEARDVIARELRNVNALKGGSKGFRDRYIQWALGDIPNRINILEDWAKEAYVYEKMQSPSDWVRLARREFREREMQRQRQIAINEWMNVGLETPSGWEVPMFKHMKSAELIPVRDELRREAEARAGIHNMYVGWRANCQRLKGLCAAFGYTDRDTPLPPMPIAELNLGWINTLAKGRDGLGGMIGKGIEVYVRIGEYRGADDKPADDNVFSQALSPDRVLLVRESVKDEIRLSVGDSTLGGEYLDELCRDAEELAYRLMYIFGLAGKYNYGQNPGNSERDDLASIFRPNDAWQGLRASNVNEPAPLAIIGARGDPSKQPFSGRYGGTNRKQVSFVASYPEYATVRVGHDDIKVYDLLRQGRFDEVDWLSIGKGYGFFTFKMNTGRKVKEALEESAHKTDVAAVDALKGFNDQLFKALEHVGAPEDVNRVRAAIKYNWARAVLERHDPTNEQIPMTQYWTVNAIHSFIRNMGQPLVEGGAVKGIGSGEAFLPENDLRRFRSKEWGWGRQLAWGFKLGTKRAENF